MKGVLELLVALLAVSLLSPSLYSMCNAEEEPLDVILDGDIKAEKVPLKTRDNTVKEEAEAISDDGFSVADRALLRGEESHTFKAEINQLMGIIINSLYSNRDIFLRELISNSADALTKIRFLSLKDSAALGDTPQLEIRIKFDADSRLLHIRDTGIGMTKNDLINNLGSIAKSGTKEFIEKMSAGDIETIGQFGVGFYSSFLVSDKVTVTSKNNDDSQHIWEGTSDDPSSYTVAEDPRGNTLGRGTMVTLHLRDDSVEYLNQNKLKELIVRYNEFISYPIYLWASHEESREVPDDSVDEEVDEEEEEEISIDDDEESEEEEEEEPAPKTKTITETVWGWERVNPNPPLWTRSKSDISDEEYTTFYKNVLGSSEEPFDHLHFKAEGDVEFNALIYIPSSLPYGFFEPNFKSQLKLYVKRVFITDNFNEMIPSYLSFVKGVLDSDDLPLNVSREMLQENKILDVIKKKLVRKIIALFQDLADDKDNEEKWNKFYDTFATNIKLGVLQDTQNKTRLSKLLRFITAKNSEKKISVEEYIENMKKNQKDIYYLGGETLESIKNSPLLEGLTKRGYDVLLLPEPIDEYCISSLGKYDGKFSFVDISKEGLKLSDAEEERLKELNTKFEPLSNYLKDVLQDKVSKVQVSNKLSKAPCAIVAQSWGYSANMERILKAQALKDDRYLSPMAGKRVLEINPYHPIVKKLLQLVEEEQTNDDTRDVAHVLYDTAVLNSGYALTEPADLTGRINRMMSTSLEVDPDAQIEEEQIEELEDEEQTTTEEEESTTEGEEDVPPEIDFSEYL
eukprot:TRINITY_DN10_c0_g2_i1.p1 TRINITY_DN10_c0_g2~~TRINITY_DN10_c0_g2_i1.p1  ORF type:complete len:797 (-),score=209.33 TRINITY_DN10_c0_g2_i1:128-2518(-)